MNPSNMAGNSRECQGTFVLDFGDCTMSCSFVGVVESKLKARDKPLWTFPVGTVQYPPELWYAATLHDLSGKLNNGYEHSGIDLNLDKAPWGDVDRGLPVFAVTEGEIWDVRYTARNLGCIVIKVQHDGAPLWVRYWHLEPDALFGSWEIGNPIETGERLGVLGNYIPGDHLHFDMALDAFDAGYWLTPAIRWIDPVPVLKTHLPPKLVNAMLTRGRTDWP